MASTRGFILPSTISKSSENFCSVLDFLNCVILDYDSDLISYSIPDILNIRLDTKIYCIPCIARSELDSFYPGYSTTVLARLPGLQVDIIGYLNRWNSEKPMYSYV